MTAAVLGHQGGWDEILFVLLPIVLFAGLLALANRRATRAMNEPAQDGAEAATPPHDPE